MSEHRTYSQTEQAFLEVIRTPYQNAYLKFEHLARLIMDCSAVEQKGLVKIYLQLYHVPDLEIAPVVGEPTLSMDEWRIAKGTLAALNQKGDLAFVEKLEAGAPLDEVAQAVCMTLHAIAEQGMAAVAFCLYTIASLENLVSYLDDAVTVPLYDRDSEAVAQFLVNQPSFFALVANTAKWYYNDPYLLGQVLIQAVTNLPDERTRTLGLGFLLASVLTESHLQSAGTDGATPESVQQPPTPIPPLAN